MLVLRAIASIVDDTLCTWCIAVAKPAIRSPKLDDQFGQPLEARDRSVDRFALPAFELALACSPQQPRLVG